MNRRRWFLGVLAAVLVLVLGGTVVALVGNNYRITEERLSIPVPGGALDAVLARPEDGPARGLVVTVHGDGPVEATHDGLYRPFFEAAADAGFATLSWSKPGIGTSSGNWLEQSMDDRAAEVSTVIDWARDRADIPTGAIALWGASQAGWVLPAVTAVRDDIDAVVTVSPAVNWLRQGRYNLLAELDHDGADATRRAETIAASDHTRALLDRHADYDTYLTETDDSPPMTADRWGFVARNHTADATANLRATASKHIPTLLMLAEHDRNVDIAETATTYTELLGDDLTVEYFDAAHSLAKPAVEDSALVGLTIGLFRPRALLADGVLDTYRHFLREQD
ncbi:alpha/beta hydrolase family protein [Nocardia sp. NPDC058176]|uniref:alpha/beta hydrolase family protein n=1 Tax=Nocardia sp. NPDC058176 TaxID=3346368 RepID=UPI0036DE24D7